MFKKYLMLLFILGYVNSLFFYEFYMDVLGDVLGVVFY